MSYLGCVSCGSNAYVKIRPYPDFEKIDLVKCTYCELIQAQPLPTDEFLNHFYQNIFGNSAERGYTMSLKDEKGFRRRAWHQLNFIKEFCNIDAENGNRHVLDVGCHAASLLSLFRERGWQITGMDPNPRNKYGEAWYGIKIIQRLFSPGLFDTETFDVILHSHVLEHVRDPKSYLSEFYRVLKPGGSVFIEVPNELLFEQTPSKKVRPHLYFFTPKTLSQLGESVGFKVVCVRVLDIDPFRGNLLSHEGRKWLKLRADARYDAHGKSDLRTLLPFYGRFFKKDRFFKDLDPRAVNLRIIFKK